jgi:Leucine-rich repeat (LRR) protein
MRKRLLLAIIFLLVDVAGRADVNINSNKFPDDNFRTWLLSQGYGADGVLTNAEMASVTKIDVSNINIKDLTGIEFFIALKQLRCNSCQLTKLDVSNNTALEELKCNSCQLTKLDVSNNTALEELGCSFNKLTSLDLSKNVALARLFCDNNYLTALDVSNNPKIIYLDCSSNKLTSLVVSKTGVLSTLRCFCNRIGGIAMDELVEKLPRARGGSGSMDVIYYEKEHNVMFPEHVAAVKAKGWNPTYFDNASQKWLRYDGSEIPEGHAIDAANFPDAIFRNWIHKQDYGIDDVLTNAEIADIKNVDLQNKGIKSLKGIEFLTSLTNLNCGWNKLQTLDVSKNTALQDLRCWHNQLTALDVSNNTKLSYLDCSSNLLTALDFSKNYELVYLFCENNNLTALNVLKNKKLNYLDCHNNRLENLNLSINDNLFQVYCYQNQINGDGMDILVSSLMEHSTKARLYVIYNENERNVMTVEQVSEARAKKWVPFYYDAVTNNWEEYNGNDDPNGISLTTDPTLMGVGKTYDLSGRRVEKPGKGIYIRNGKKILY